MQRVLTASAPPLAGPADARRTTPAHRQKPRQARRRLRLGITGVGASVVLSLALLGATLLGAVPIDAEWRLVPGPLGVPVSAASVALAVYLAHALLLVAVEHAGGRRAVRAVPAFGAWLVAWLRGVLVLGVLAGSGVAVIVTAGSVAGTFAAAAAAFALALALLIAQGPLARLTASLSIRSAPEHVADGAREAGIPSASVRVVDASDEAFVGGWVGWAAGELWIPASWTQEENADLLTVQWHRRQAQRTSYARRRGWWRAALWAAVGLLLTAPLLPYGWSDARLWLLLPALATLWSFVAVLMLPSVSRAAVFYADAAAARALGTTRTVAAIEQLDAAQDDEPERTRVVEFIFHPVPSVGNRRRRLLMRRQPPFGGGHQQTRLTLFASLATGSVLGRMVHCNIGRPSLWVMYPGD
jgi:hypothetical protein